MSGRTQQLQTFVKDTQMYAANFQRVGQKMILFTDAKGVRNHSGIDHNNFSLSID